MANKKPQEPEDGAVVPSDGDTEQQGIAEAAAAPSTEAREDARREEAAEAILGPDSERPPEPLEPPEPEYSPEPEYRPAHSDAEPVPVSAQLEHAEEDVAEEERGWSFAARALAFLLLLLAGAGLGIWGAPRLAPMLPAGLAPVAAWLTPGQAEAEARLAALEQRLEGGLGALGALDARFDALPDPAALEGRAQGLVEAAQADLTTRIDALRQEVSEGAAGDVGARLGQLETALQGAVTEFGALKGQIETRAAGLSQDAAQSIDVYRAELDGLRAEVGKLSGSVSGLDARLEEVRANAEARVVAAQQAAAQVEATASAERDVSAARADLAAIRAALASGAPFLEPLDRLAQASGVAVPAGLSAAAATGVQSPAQLRAGFEDTAHGAIRAAIVAGAGEGLLARSRAFLESQVASRSLSPQEGLDPDAVLSRVEDALRRDDLATALTEADQLPSEARDALSGWVAAARLRADAEAGLEEVSAAISPTN